MRILTRCTTKSEAWSSLWNGVLYGHRTWCSHLRIDQLILASLKKKHAHRWSNSTMHTVRVREFVVRPFQSYQAFQSLFIQSRDHLTCLSLFLWCCSFAPLLTLWDSLSSRRSKRASEGFQVQRHSGDRSGHLNTPAWPQHVRTFGVANVFEIF